MPHNDYQHRQPAQMQAPSPLSSMGQHAAPVPQGDAYQQPLQQNQQQQQAQEGRPPADGYVQQTGQDAAPPGQLPMAMPRNSAGEDVAAAALVNLVQVAHSRCRMLTAVDISWWSLLLYALKLPALTTNWPPWRLCGALEQPLFRVSGCVLLELVWFEQSTCVPHCRAKCCRRADAVTAVTQQAGGDRGGSAGRSSDGSRDSRRPQRRAGKPRSDQEDYEI